MNVDIKPSLKIRNMVARAEIDKEIHLENICEYIDEHYDVETEHRQTPPVGVQIRPNPENLSFFSIHRTGKIVIKGANSPSDIRNTEQFVRGILYACGLTDSGSENLGFEIVNIVANDKIDLGKKFNLYKVKEALVKSGEEVYEQSEAYPALNWSPDEKNWTVLFYESGAMTISGCKDPDELSDVSQQWKEIISSHL